MPGKKPSTDGRQAPDRLTETRKDYAEDLALDAAQRPSPSNPTGRTSTDEPQGGKPSDGPVNQVIEFSDSSENLTAFEESISMEAKPRHSSESDNAPSDAE